MGEDNRPTDSKEQNQERSGKAFILHRYDFRKAKRQVCAKMFYLLLSYYYMAMYFSLATFVIKIIDDYSLETLQSSLLLKC